MTIASYLREIGRGKDGARSLTEPQAHDLMSRILDGAVSDLELGAFVLAMRIKGESVAELEGFARATHERCRMLETDRPVVVLPSYNGARKLPNLTPLLACLLARDGIPVLVHGPTDESGRVGTAEIFRALELPLSTRADEVAAAWARGEPAFVATHALCPPLARLLDVRRVVGLRNSGHTIAKILAPMPAGSALRVVNYTHPDYAALLRTFLARAGAHAVLMRGTEGEPVADPRRLPRLEVVLGGQARDDLSSPAQDGALTELPALPNGIDARTTAGYVRQALRGEVPVPAPLRRQAACLAATARAIASIAPADPADPAAPGGTGGTGEAGDAGDAGKAGKAGERADPTVAP